MGKMSRKNKISKKNFISRKLFKDLLNLSLVISSSQIIRTIIMTNTLKINVQSYNKSMNKLLVQIRI